MKKKIHYNTINTLSEFFNALCKRVTSSLQKRKHHKTVSLSKVTQIIYKYYRYFSKVMNLNE